MEPQQAFGQVLRELRNRAGLSQEALALASGLDRTFISLLERGLRQPSLTTLFQLAPSLAVPPSRIVEHVEQVINASRKSRKSTRGSTPSR